MPIKLPKGFARRKSSGNVLDEVEPATESSFRVLERPNGLNKGKPFTSGEGRFYRPATAESDNIFAGIEKPLPHNRASGGTNNSASTGLYDSSSSARHSSSSTLPSSTDVPVHNDLSRGVHDLPVPPVPESPSVFSLRAAGRTFSFGTKSRTSTPTSQQQSRPFHQHTTASPATTRDRATTASSASTATPPKLLDSDLHIGGAADDDDEFGSMFENYGKRKSAILLDSTKMTNIQLNDRPTPTQNDRGVRLAPINTDRGLAVEPSPHSWNSQTSTDALMHDDNAKHQGPTATLAPSESMASTKSAAAPESPDSYDSDHSPSFIADNDDAEIVRQSILLTNKSPPPPASTSPHPNTTEETPLFDSDEITSSAQLASQYEDHVASVPSTQNKVMTPAQFERYRQQREMTRALSNASKSDVSETGNDYEDDEEDEDEAEKTREAARQRRKQEAHLSVYRQQMMKVIGQQAPHQSTGSLSGSQTLRPISEHGSISTPNLLSRSSMLGLPTIAQESGKSDGEDDEDVPLAILAAHGFPNKNRPPTRLNASSSNPNLRVSYSGSPGPSYAEHASEPRASLPVFARNLPRDPYFGASIVNSSQRETLAMGGGSPALGSSPASLPPGGLVGVIANEERARAMRRGSPNAQAQSAGLSRPYSVANMAQMNAPGPWSGPAGLPQHQPPAVMTPGEQAQLQISQQMTEIMQVQVQMMQQMMQMQGASPGQQQPPMINPGFLPPFGSPGNIAQRPLSTASSFQQLPVNPTQIDQRTLSMMDPNLSRWNLNRPASIHPDSLGRPLTPQGGHGYTPSIAPSERSNVGMASRYRPVSMAGQEQQMPRSSTFTSSLKPWNNENPRPTSVSPSHLQPGDRKSTSMATVTVRPVGGTARDSVSGKENMKNAGPDEDEDEAWADLMKKREKKKSSWKLKKENSALGDLLHMVH